MRARFLECARGRLVGRLPFARADQRLGQVDPRLARALPLDLLLLPLANGRVRGVRSLLPAPAEQLRDRNIDNAYDISQFTPNFTMSRNLGRRLDRPTIRGQFQPGRGEPNASFFVDGEIS